MCDELDEYGNLVHRYGPHPNKRSLIKGIFGLAMYCSA